MSKQLRQSTIEKWSPYVKEFESSSLSMREFCEQEEISIKTFSRVRRRILYDCSVPSDESESISKEPDRPAFKQAFITGPAVKEQIQIRINGLDIAYPSDISKDNLTLLLSACAHVC